jgi:hypothetical protein
MTTAQAIFLIGMLGFALYVTRLRSTLTDRLIHVIIVVTGVPLVLHPSWSTELANLVGIGRGSDLIFYLFIVVSLFHFATSSARTRKQERDFATLVRAHALHHPSVPPPADSAEARDPSK